MRSALDGLLDGSVLTSPEKTYSTPLAVRQFTKETTLVDDKPVRDFPLLRGAGKHLADPDRDRPADVLKRLGLGLAGGLAAGLAGTFLLAACLAPARRRRGRRRRGPGGAANCRGAP